LKPLGGKLDFLTIRKLNNINAEIIWPPEFSGAENSQHRLSAYLGGFAASKSL
jgi:hypothetical protein